jgi:site-specific DNA recombinase
MKALVARIEISDTIVAITLNLPALRAALRLAPLRSDEAATHTIRMPVWVTKRGVEQKLVIGGGVVGPVKRDKMLKAIARAHAWFDDLCTGRVSDVSQISKREQLPRTYVQAHLPLAFLAPKIVHEILDGKQPADMTLKQLMYRTDLAPDWAIQSRQLGFAD